MPEIDEQWPDDESPADSWDALSSRHALDELFHDAGQFQTSSSYLDLVNFIARFRFYSPFNAMLVHVQMPGAKFVAPAHRWRKTYQRRIRPGARPLVILQPMSPVMFVFDASDTEEIEAAQPTLFPKEVLSPFDLPPATMAGELPQTIENAKRDGVRIEVCKYGSQQAGEICEATGKDLLFPVSKKPGSSVIVVRHRYEILVSIDLSEPAQYATIVHELAHLYCGHLGTPNDSWWPDRRGLTRRVREFEAESVAYLICGRLGIDCRAKEYLSSYLSENSSVPPISLECVLKAAGLIEQMGTHLLKPRKATS